MSFELALTEEKVKPHQVTAMHLLTALLFCGTAAMTLVFEAYGQLPEPVSFNIRPFCYGLLAGGLVLTLVALFKNRRLRSPGVNRAVRLAEIILSSGICLFAFLHALWVPAGIFAVLAAALVFSLYWESISDNVLLVCISTEGIRLPVTSRTRFLEWQEVEQVLLRFGVLTIDCCDNHLFQWNVREVPFNRNDFEHWCSTQVAQHRHKREQEW